MRKLPKSYLSFLFYGNLLHEMVPCACSCETSMNPLMEPATSILKAWLNSQMAPAEKLGEFSISLRCPACVILSVAPCRDSWWLVFHFIVLSEEQMPLMPQVSLCIEFYCVRPHSNGILRRIWNIYISCLLPVLSSPLRCATLHTRPRRWAIWRRSSAWRRGLRGRGQGGRRGWWKRCGRRKVECVRRRRPDGGRRIGWRRSNGWRRVDGVRWGRRRCWGKAGGQGGGWTVWRRGQLALRRGRAEGAWRSVDG